MNFPSFPKAIVLSLPFPSAAKREKERERENEDTVASSASYGELDANDRLSRFKRIPDALHHRVVYRGGVSSRASGAT